MVSQAVVDDSQPASDKGTGIESAWEDRSPRSGRSAIGARADRGACQAIIDSPCPDESEAERSSRLIKLRHLMVLTGDPDAAVAQIEGMADAEQEYLRHHLLGTLDDDRSSGASHPKSPVHHRDSADS